jgi:HAMP domain-containing protein
MGIIPIVELLGTVLSFVVAQWVAKPITRLTQVAEKITRGDLQPCDQYPISHDEIGDLARSLERMRASLKATMARLGHESV